VIDGELWVGDHGQLMETLKHATVEMPVHALRVEVVAGVDLGACSGGESDSCAVGTAEGNDVVLHDPSASRFHLELTRQSDGIRVVDHRSTNGTWLGAVRIERAVLPPGTVLRIGASQVRIGDGPTSNVVLHPGESLAGMVGRSAVMRRLFTRIERAAQSGASTLVTGESGTGKELVARALHDLGPRRTRPFVVVDCGALAPTLVASELFGHERGSFTGADRQHIGAIERASGGTVFFDEIGELPSALQANLLGVLQRRRFRRLGGRTDLPVDVRVVSATHRDLRSEVNASTFRLDLFYRLAVVVLRIPPLRERAEDVPLLVASFARAAGHDGDIGELFSPETLAQLSTQRWSGNVRELQNLIESTIAMGDLAEASAASEATTRRGDGTPNELVPYRVAREHVLAEFERDYVGTLYARANGNASLAAREARMDRSHLLDLLRKHGLKS